MWLTGNPDLKKKSTLLHLASSKILFTSQTVKLSCKHVDNGNMKFSYGNVWKISFQSIIKMWDRIFQKKGFLTDLVMKKCPPGPIFIWLQCVLYARIILFKNVAFQIAIGFKSISQFNRGWRFGTCSATKLLLH